MLKQCALAFSLCVLVACDRPSRGQQWKSCEYVRDLPSGHIIEESDLNCMTVEIEGGDLLLDQVHKDVVRDYLSPEQGRHIIGRPLRHSVVRGAKAHSSDVDAPSAAPPTI